MIIQKNRPFGSVVCKFCKEPLNGAIHYIRSGSRYNIICSNCQREFSKKDMELMKNLFLAYGSYFGKLQNPRYPVYDVIQELIQESIQNPKNLTSAHLDVELLYKALLHGVTPHQLRQGFRLHAGQALENIKIVISEYQFRSL